MNTRLIFTTLVLILFLGSCSLICVPEDSGLVFETIEGAAEWIATNIKYDESPGIQSPAETVELGSGGCIDFCLLFMQIAHEQFGHDPELIYYEREEYGDIHCIVCIDGNYWEPQGGIIIPFDLPIYDRYDYDSAMYTAWLYENDLMIF